MAGTQVVIGLATSFEIGGADFFETSGRNLLAAGAPASGTISGCPSSNRPERQWLLRAKVARRN
jgi:hypothetical protein